MVAPILAVPHVMCFVLTAAPPQAPLSQAAQAASPQTPGSPAAVVLLGLFLAIGLAVWGWVLKRRLAGQAVLSWQPRRPVPWEGIHVVIIVFCYFALMVSVPKLFLNLSHFDLTAVDQGPKETQHIVAQLLERGEGFGTRVLCVAAATITAPFCEEFVFRLVLQGWLEARERRWRRRWRARMPLPPGLLSILIVALLFGVIHARGAAPTMPVEVLTVSLAGAAVANVLTVLFGVAILLADVRATPADLGWDRRQFAADVVRGLWALPAIGVIVYPLQLVLSALLSPEMAADPISLVVFGAMLGLLYWRTHRLAAPLMLHMGLNTLTTLLLLLSR